MIFQGGAAERPADPAALAQSRRGAGMWWTLPAVFLLLLHFGERPSSDLDPTWSMVLRWAHLHGLQWGRDIVFTYGPLGFLTPMASYYPGADRLFDVAQILFALGQAAVVALALRAVPGWIALAVIAVVAIWLRGIAGDAAWYATFAFAFAVVVNSAQSVARRRWPLWAALGFLLAAIASIKFTSTVVLALWVSCLVAWCLCRRRYADAAVICGSAVVSWLVIWLASGQELSGLFAYLATSFDIVSGYGPAMSMEADRRLEAFAIAAQIVEMVALVWIVRARYGSWATWFTLAFFGALSFIVWRASLTRADHWPMFFACASLIPLAALCCEGRYRSARSSTVAAGIVVLLSMTAFLATSPATPGAMVSEAGASVAQNLRVLRGLKRFERARKAEWEALRASVKLPRIAETVGRESVDVLMLDQVVALGLELDYRPRPVFQSYQANTAATLRLNEAHFSGDAAPRFVILKMQAIDARFPMQEDGLALAMLLKRYRPRLIEAGYLLLERTSLDAAPITLPPASAYRESRLGEPIELPQSDSPLLIFADVQLSWLGRLRAFLLREPPLALNLQTQAGEQLTFRLLRRGAQSGFVIAPLLLDARDWTRSPGANADRRAAQVSISPVDSSQANLFAQEVRVALVPFTGPFAMEDHSALEESAAYPGFSQPASDQSAVFDVVNERGHRVVFMHAPAWIEFSLAPGEYRVRGALGLLERAAADGGCIAGHADGVMAEASIRELGTQPRALWQARINPFAAPADNAERELDIESFHLPRAATLRIAFAMQANNTCDWSYLRDVQIEPVP
ncbi:MAG: hypothetical protein JSS42_14965 [Proteobacteria bacterium]|nr:hypothetical protein [Pseudomonadota bacterium]